MRCCPSYARIWDSAFRRKNANGFGAAHRGRCRSPGRVHRRTDGRVLDARGQQQHGHRDPGADSCRIDRGPHVRHLARDRARGGPLRRDQCPSCRGRAAAPAGSCPTGPGPARSRRHTACAGCYGTSRSIQSASSASCSRAKVPPATVPALASSSSSTRTQPITFQQQDPGDASGEAIPVPIPNTEVKLSSAEDTERAAFRENRSSPGFLRFRGS